MNGSSPSDTYGAHHSNELTLLTVENFLAASQGLQRWPESKSLRSQMPGETIKLDPATVEMEYAGQKQQLPIQLGVVLGIFSEQSLDYLMRFYEYYSLLNNMQLRGLISHNLNALSKATTTNGFTSSYQIDLLSLNFWVRLRVAIMNGTLNPKHMFIMTNEDFSIKSLHRAFEQGQIDLQTLRYNFIKHGTDCSVTLAEAVRMKLVTLDLKSAVQLERVRCVKRLYAMLKLMRPEEARQARFVRKIPFEHLILSGLISLHPDLSVHSIHYAPDQVHTRTFTVLDAFYDEIISMDNLKLMCYYCNSEKADFGQLGAQGDLGVDRWSRCYVWLLDDGVVDLTSLELLRDRGLISSTNELVTKSAGRLKLADAFERGILSQELNSIPEAVLSGKARRRSSSGDKAVSAESDAEVSYIEMHQVSPKPTLAPGKSPRSAADVGSAMKPAANLRPKPTSLKTSSQPAANLSPTDAASSLTNGPLPNGHLNGSAEDVSGLRPAAVNGKSGRVGHPSESGEPTALKPGGEKSDTEKLWDFKEAPKRHEPTRSPHVEALNEARRRLKHTDNHRRRLTDVDFSTDQPDSSADSAETRMRNAQRHLQRSPLLDNQISQMPFEDAAAKPTDDSRHGDGENLSRCQSALTLDDVRPFDEAPNLSAASSNLTSPLRLYERETQEHPSADPSISGLVDSDLYLISRRIEKLNFGESPEDTLRAFDTIRTPEEARRELEELHGYLTTLEKKFKSHGAGKSVSLLTTATPDGLTNSDDIRNIRDFLQKEVDEIMYRRRQLETLFEQAPDSEKVRLEKLKQRLTKIMKTVSDQLSDTQTADQLGRQIDQVIDRLESESSSASSEIDHDMTGVGARPSRADLQRLTSSIRRDLDQLDTYDRQLHETLFNDRRLAKWVSDTRRKIRLTKSEASQVLATLDRALGAHEDGRSLSLVGSFAKPGPLRPAAGQRILFRAFNSVHPNNLKATSVAQRPADKKRSPAGSWAKRKHVARTSASTALAPPARPGGSWRRKQAALQMAENRDRRINHNDTPTRRRLMENRELLRKRIIDESLEDLIGLDDSKQIIRTRIENCIKECNCNPPISFRHLYNNIYKICDRKVLIRVMNTCVMVRVGGGWVTIENFVNTYDPCRRIICYAKSGSTILYE